MTATANQPPPHPTPFPPPQPHPKNHQAPDVKNLSFVLYFNERWLCDRDRQGLFVLITMMTENTDTVTQRYAMNI